MKCIVTTTINPPTEAIIKFNQKKGWTLIIVGDRKTPHEKYKGFNYLSPSYQEEHYKELSDMIGWDSIQRRNIGFIEAYRMGAEVIATVDDDNIPYDWWGDNLVGQEAEVDFYHSEPKVFDPLSVTKDNYLWHRGYPLELLGERHRVQYRGKIKRKVLVQADLWDGDPDIDAIARMIYRPIVKYDIADPYCSDKISPFNSQNTFLSREVIPYYADIPFVGRMSDIWGAYILQHKFPDSVIYSRASVYQQRNKQDVITNLEDEILGYRKTWELLQNYYLARHGSYMPKKAIEFYELYKSQFKKS